MQRKEPMTGGGGRRSSGSARSFSVVAVLPGFSSVTQEALGPPPFCIEPTGLPSR